MQIHKHKVISALVLWLTTGLVYAASSIDDQDISLEQVPKFLDDARCIACHGAQEMRIGPPWLAIGARYQGADSVEKERLAAKIRHGGAGNWGIVPMNSNTKVTPQQAAIIVEWLLQFPSTQQ